MVNWNNIDFWFNTCMKRADNHRAYNFSMLYFEVKDLPAMEKISSTEITCYSELFRSILFGALAVFECFLVINIFRH